MEKSAITMFTYMFDDMRNETLKGIEHLSKEQLHKSPLDGEYPVGSYLMHLAECDIFWLEVLSGTEQSADLKEKCFYDKWFDPSQPPAPPVNPMALSEYREVIDAARKNFIDYISKMKDSQLEDEVLLKGKTKETTLQKKWIIYHLLEHEAHHRGQMFMLIRKAGWSKK